MLACIFLDSFPLKTDSNFVCRIDRDVNICNVRRLRINHHRATLCDPWLAVSLRRGLHHADWLLNIWLSKRGGHVLNCPHVFGEIAKSPLLIVRDSLKKLAAPRLRGAATAKWAVVNHREAASFARDVILVQLDFFSAPRGILQRLRDVLVFEQV